MRTRFFGEPWPTPELRAPTCDDDTYRVKTPVNQLCIGCFARIQEGEQGVVMGTDVRLKGAYYDDEQLMQVVCAEHLHCFLLDILGPAVRDVIKEP